MSFIKENLSDIEIEKVKSFVNDEVMLEAVKKVFLASMYSNGTLRSDVKSNPLTNGALALVSLACSGRGTISNEELGEDLRGLFHGIQLLESGFRELEKAKEEKGGVVESPYNEAV